ncbi:MAG: porphobilinogen synthase [Candidatus Omnitrophica bacterium]|nr:porphobilinogen synthase [Candidatus Omnitrophota bacterium]
MQSCVWRPKRLRQNANFRRLVRETRLGADHLVMPFFVREGKGIKNQIASLPGNYQLSVDNLVAEAKAAKALGIPAVLLFGIPEKKDERGSGAYAKNGIIQKATAALKQKVPGLLVITDVCLCEFTSTGHCGILKGGAREVRLDNDATLELLAKTAVSQARSGADMVAPSAMADGQVAAIRKALDEDGFTETPIMAYSAKYASSFYGPFRDAAESAPKLGNRLTYQMDPSNFREALREIALDVQEGADIVMVKPALAYLDIIARAKQKFQVPVAAYNVSGEFAMVKAAARLGWLDETRTILEILTAIRRAGADIIITYHAIDVAKKLH